MNHTFTKGDHVTVDNRAGVIWCIVGPTQGARQ